MFGKHSEMWDAVFYVYSVVVNAFVKWIVYSVIAKISNQSQYSLKDTYVLLTMFIQFIWFPAMIIGLVAKLFFGWSFMLIGVGIPFGLIALLVVVANVAFWFKKD